MEIINHIHLAANQEEIKKVVEDYINNGNFTLEFGGKTYRYVNVGKVDATTKELGADLAAKFAASIEEFNKEIRGKIEGENALTFHPDTL